MNRYQPSKLVHTINSFERLEEEFDDGIINIREIQRHQIRVGKKAKLPNIFITVDNFYRSHNY
jgi:hypothetical protein